MLYLCETLTTDGIKCFSFADLESGSKGSAAACQHIIDYEESNKFEDFNLRGRQVIELSVLHSYMGFVETRFGERYELNTWYATNPGSVIY